MELGRPDLESIDTGTSLVPVASQFQSEGKPWSSRCDSSASTTMNLAQLSPTIETITLSDAIGTGARTLRVRQN